MTTVDNGQPKCRRDQRQDDVEFVAKVSLT